MIRCLVSGVLHLDPIQRTSASGKSFTTGKMRADGKNGDSVWCSLIAFNAEAERLAELKAGDGECGTRTKGDAAQGVSRRAKPAKPEVSP